MRFRPCIDIHNGAVKQIVGGSLKDEADFAKDNFVSELKADFYADLYRRSGLAGGHVILLNPVGSTYDEADVEQAKLALAAYPQGLQIGGGIGFEAGRLLRLGEKDLPLATLCGMSAVFSALFGTPLTAAIFAMEVISVGVFYYAGLIPCLTAALVGYLVSLLMGVPPTRFAVADPGLDPWTMLLVILLAIGCAVVSILFCRGLQKTGKLAARLLPNPYGRVLVGGALVIVLTLLVGNTNYNGAGMEMVEQAVSGDVEPWAWLWKLLFTAVTIGFGYKGGEVVPSFFVGACFGCVLGGAMGLPAGFGAAIGLVAVFCGAVNCPIASVFLSIELFSTGDVLYFAMACAISYLLSGYCGLYSSQTILYSKMRAEFINIHTNENEEHHG